MNLCSSKGRPGGSITEQLAFIRFYPYCTLQFFNGLEPTALATLTTTLNQFIFSHEQDREKPKAEKAVIKADFINYRAESSDSIFRRQTSLEYKTRQASEEGRKHMKVSLSENSFRHNRNIN